MQTYNFEQNTADITAFIKRQTNEPLVLKNDTGMNYLVVPYSEDNWQEIFLMLKAGKTIITII